MHAIILAGGFGTRLKDVVGDVPKPLAPIGGKPFLEILIKRLMGQGVTSITLSAHHMHAEIERFIAKQAFNIPVNVIVEEKPLGTGGAIRFCLSQLRSSSSGLTGGSGSVSVSGDPRLRGDDGLGRAPVLVLNGDSFVEVGCAKLYAHHLAKKAPLTLAIRKVSDTSRYSEVITRNNIVTHFLSLGAKKAGFINAGFYVMDADIFERFPIEPEAFSFEHDFMPRYVKQLKAASFQAGDYFIDIGVPEDYARAQTELLQFV